MAKRKTTTRLRRAGKFVGYMLKTTTEGVQYLARGLKFFGTEIKEGVKEGRRG